MKNRFAALPFALMLSMAAPLTAQEAEKPADEGLTMGEEVKAPPQPYFREESGDWKLECLKTGTAVEPCQLFQEAYDAEGKPLANIRLFRLPDGAQAEAGAVIAVPLEVLLTAQMTISIDGTQARRYPYSVCDPLGCYARIGLTSDEIGELKRGAKAEIKVVPFVAPDKQMTVAISLKGFTAGYDKIQATQN